MSPSILLLSKSAGVNELVKLRRELEQSHVEGLRSVSDRNRLWENLGHEDPHIRYAARIGLGTHVIVRPMGESKISERDRDTQAMLEAALAIARSGNERTAGTYAIERTQSNSNGVKSEQSPNVWLCFANLRADDHSVGRSDAFCRRLQLISSV